MTHDHGAAPGSPLSFSSYEFLRLIEAHGLTGSWGWSFITGEQVWSPGLVRLCGLAPDVKPSYALLVNLVHPEDRPSLETPSQVAEGGMLRDHTVRLIRPDGTLRTLAFSGEVHHDPEGRPLSASGIVLDVTDRDRLARAQREDRRRRWALFEQAGTWMNTAAYRGGAKSGSDELLSLTGVSQDEFREDCIRVVVPEDRSRVRAHVRQMIQAGRSFSVTKRLTMAGGGSEAFRFVYAPVRDERAQIQSWATLASRDGGPQVEVEGDLRRGLEQGVKGEHLRGARALLDWSKSDLARASGLSLSTIARLEDDAEGPAARSRHNALAALRQAGIGFVVVDAGTIAVFKR